VLFLAQDDRATVELVTNQLLLLATIVGAIAALPPLIEFIIDARKRRERIALSLDVGPPPEQDVQLIGLESVVADLADLIDRAADPAPYRELRLGNELLIVGPALSGKKSLARRIAREARIARIITVYNPRNADALARAKSLLRARTDESVMLLLPSIDQVFDNDDDDEDVEAELDALIDAVASRDDVLVVGTAQKLAEGDDLDNLFGYKVLLPGAPAVERRASPPREDLRRVIAEVCAHQLERATRAGCVLEGLTPEQFTGRVVARVGNPAEVEDILEAARTTAIFELRRGRSKAPTLTPDVLSKAIRRVMGSE
jgi:hypothetical protein